MASEWNMDIWNTFFNCRLTEFLAEKCVYASEVKTGDDMRQTLDQGLALFHDLYTRSPSLYLSGCWHQSGRGCRSFPGGNTWQKWTPDSYHRRFDAYARLNLAICDHFDQKSGHSLPFLKKGDFMGQSGFWAVLCAGEIAFISSIQARWAGDFMSQNWRTYGNSDINDADEAYRNRSTAAEEATPEPLTDDIDINVEQPVGTIIEYRGERWPVLSSDYVTAGDAADLEDGWDATVSVGWHTHLRRVKAGDKVLEVVADRFAAGEVQRIGDRGVWFIDEEHAIFWEDLAYDSELGLYQKSKFPQKGGASDQR